MGTLFSALDVARSGMQAAQIQMDVAAHNIANVNKEGFSRQRTEITSRLPNNRSFGQLGRGVQITDVTRVRDTFLDIVFHALFPHLLSMLVRVQQRPSGTAAERAEQEDPNTDSCNEAHERSLAFPAVPIHIESASMQRRC